jgi:hypothetical protein
MQFCIPERMEHFLYLFEKVNFGLQFPNPCIPYIRINLFNSNQMHNFLLVYTLREFVLQVSYLCTIFREKNMAVS